MPVSSKQNSNAWTYKKELNKYYDGFPFMVLTIDLDGAAIVDANPAAIQSLGYAKKTLLKKRPDQIDTHFTVAMLLSSFESLQKKEEQTTFHSAFKKRDGSSMEVAVYLHPFENNGKKHLLVFAFDNAHLGNNKEQIQFYTALLQSISEAIITTDEAFCITGYNQHAQEMFGWKENECVGKNLGEFVILENASTLQQIAEALSKQGHWKGEASARKNTGGIIPVQLSAGVVKTNTTAKTGSIIIIAPNNGLAHTNGAFEHTTKGLQQQLAEKTGELTRYFERMPDGFAAYDEHWNFVYINEKAAAFTDYEPHELIGKNLWETFPELVGTSMHANYLRAMREQTVVDTEEYLPAFGKWLEGAIFPSPKGSSIFFRDITDKKQKEQALKESEEMYRTIVETAQEGVWQIDEQNNTVFVNSYLTNLLGYTKEEMTGRSFLEFIDETAKQEALALVEKRKKGIAEQHEFTFLKKDGTPVYTHLQSTPLFKNGKYAGALAMILNTSERRIAEDKVAAGERRFSALFEHSHDGIALLTQDGITQEISPSVATILGRTEDELLGNTPLDFVAPEYKDFISALFHRLLGHPQHTKTVEYEVLMPDGSRKWLESTFSNLLEEPAVNAVIINYRDITERKTAAEENNFKANLLNAVGQSVIATDLEGR